MKTTSLFLFALALLAITACKNDPPATESGIAVAAENQVEAETPAGNGRSTTSGSMVEPVTPDPNDRYVKALIQYFWVVEFWQDHVNEKNKNLNRGSWWKFNPDGTFTAGKFEEETHNGSWTITHRDSKTFLKIDANIDAFDSEFDIQGVTRLDDAMSWVGTDTYNQSHLAVKVMQLLTQPTKAQFEVE
jgi:hypothetical protein